MKASRTVCLLFLAAIAGFSKASPSAAVEEPREVLFYSDLGPDRIDVSTYPSQQRRNYAVYAQACSRCHGLARARASAPGGHGQQAGARRSHGKSLP